MDQENQHAWSAATAGAEEDFANFLDFNDVDLDFPHSEDMVDSSNAQQHAMDISNEPFARQTSSAQLHNSLTITYASSNSLNEMSLRHTIFPQQQQIQTHQGQAQISHHSHILDQQQRSESRYYRHGMVPPTPNSVEMHGQIPSYSDPQALGTYESGKHQDQMVFTPLVSPAFQLQEFAQNGEYFSPLTSPALQAQEYSNSTVLLAEQDPEQRIKDSSISITKKMKRRANTTSKDPVRTIRSSPAMKAQQKRYSSGNKSSKDLSETISELRSLQQASPRLTSNGRASALRSEANSDTGSISPEPLSEVLMPPPAAPRSSIIGQNNASNQLETLSMVAENNLPATPASLFRIQKLDTLSVLHSDLPMSQSAPLNAPTKKPDTPSTLDLTSSVDVTDSVASSRAVQSRNSTTSSLPTTASQTPDVSSPTQSQIFPSSKDSSASSRARKKRGSSSHVSPALRPRISPSIKPLLPGVATYDSETTAALLANKSNYERIIDGSASQLGVTYSAQLSENLTSKRTSHKIAEQGRRNRINTALTEIQTLLPDDLGKDSIDNASSGPGGASKARTVENAIEFIKSLKRELADTKLELMHAKSQVEDLEAKAKQLEGNVN